MCFFVSIRLRVPCCLWFEWVIARVVCTNMGLTSFWILRSIGSKSFFVVSLFLLCLFGEFSHPTISCCVHRSSTCFFRIFHIDWLMCWSMVGLVDCLIDWLNSCVTGWLNDFIALSDWSIDRLLGWLIDWLTDCVESCRVDVLWLYVCWFDLIGWLIDWYMDRLIDWGLLLVLILV